MKKFIQNKLKEQKGLTLIELLAVIVILAIIAAIAIPAIGNIIDNSRVGTMKSDALNAISAYELYSLDENVEADTAVTDEELVSGYLDSKASFEDDSISITNGLLTGDAEIGGVKVSFEGASKDDINALSNNSEDGADTSNITVTR